MDDETQPILDWNNPFLRNMPMVAIVRQKGFRNGENVVSDEIKTKRVLFRLTNPITVPAMLEDIELMPTNTALDDVLGFNDLAPF